MNRSINNFYICTKRFLYIFIPLLRV